MAKAWSPSNGNSRTRSGSPQGPGQESAGYHQKLFGEIQPAVKAIVDTNGFDIVFAYPDAITPEEMQSPLYYDLKMRPPAAMPFYVSPHADMTAVLVETLNKNFPPPAGRTGRGQTPAPPRSGADPPMGARPLPAGQKVIIATRPLRPAVAGPRGVETPRDPGPMVTPGPRTDRRPAARR